jgi:galactitol-specific phosphotransferase system IIB component
MTYKFDDKKHVHTLDGKRLHGVTSVLKYWGDPGGLINWAANMAVDHVEKVLKTKEIEKEDLESARKAHTRKRDKAGDIGTKVHKELEDAMNDWITAGFLMDSKNKTVQAVLEWLRDEGIKPLKSEMHVYSRKHWYGGIADGVIEKDGKRYILDFKTSNYIYTTAFIQCGAYSTAVKEMKKSADVAGVVIVHIPKGKSFDPEKNVYWRYDIENLETMWLNILETYKLDKELNKVIWKK